MEWIFHPTAPPQVPDQARQGAPPCLCRRRSGHADLCRSPPYHEKTEITKTGYPGIRKVPVTRERSVFYRVSVVPKNGSANSPRRQVKLAFPLADSRLKGNFMFTFKAAAATCPGFFLRFSSQICAPLSLPPRSRAEPLRHTTHVGASKDAAHNPSLCGTRPTRSYAIQHVSGAGSLLCFRFFRDGKLINPICTLGVRTKPPADESVENLAPPWPAPGQTFAERGIGGALRIAGNSSGVGCYAT